MAQRLNLCFLPLLRVLLRSPGGSQGAPKGLLALLLYFLGGGLLKDSDSKDFQNVQSQCLNIHLGTSGVLPGASKVVNRRSIPDFFQGDIERLLNNASELDILGRIGTFGSIRKTF